MKQGVKRLLALFLAAVMVCAVCVISALAFPSYKDALADGHKYTIYTALDKRMALDATANNIQISVSNWGDSQTFTITKVLGEWYKIVGTSGKVVDVYGINKAPGTNVFPCSYNGGDNQLWKFVKDGDGYRIQSKLGTFLDVTGGKTENGTNVQAYSETKSNAQLWYLEDLQYKEFRFYDTNSKPNKPLESPYAITTPQSKTSLPMIYLRAGETIEQTIQTRGTWYHGEIVNDITISWAKNSIADEPWSKNTVYPAERAGLSIKTAAKGDYVKLGGVNNVGAKRFAISADSGAAGLYRARIIWHFNPRPGDSSKTGGGTVTEFFIYVEPKA